MTNQQEKTRLFRELQRAPEVLVLLNAWDVASARIFEAQGARAIGTTSMGVAAAAGYPDQEQIPFERMLEAVERIVAAVEVPVTADLERGYGRTPQEVARSVARAVDVGVVGVNLEDGTGEAERPLCDAEEMQRRISAVRSDPRDLVLNARTDAFLARVGSREDRLEQAISRGRRYLDAGADCVFVPGGLELHEVRSLCEAFDGALNVVANPAISIPVVPTVAELRELGVARLSIGSGAMRTTLAVTRRLAAEVLEQGTYSVMATELQADDQAGYRMALRPFPHP